MKITFIGATHEVTGSCTLLENDGKYYLVDMGMEQGVDLFENVPLPVAPQEISAVFITHAHIDHTGMLPKLYKDGFRGAVYATSATCSLCRIMLLDAAHIQESEAEWKNRKAARSGEEMVTPLYTAEDVLGLMPLFVPCSYNEIVSVTDAVRLRFTDIGHLLGSACIEVWMQEGETTRKMVFSGDVGNTDQPIIRDPQTVAEADYLLIESTYGNRLHEPSEGVDPVADFASYMQRVLDRGGNLVIPAFAVGRTQELLYGIREIKRRGLLHGHDDAPVFLDSPLAQEATAIFRDVDESYLDEEALAILHRGENPVWFDGLELSVTTEDSIAINNDPRPKVIISASGMCDAGRIRHHLKHNLWRRESTILFVGYQAVGTLGRILLDGEKKTVKLFGEDIAVNAEILFMPGKSGHADRDGLLDWLAAFENKPEMVFVNHGEDAVTESFAALAAEKLGCRTYAPYSGTVFDLLEGSFVERPEGVPVVKKAAETPQAQRKRMLFEKLLAAGERLLAVIRGCEGMSNKDVGKFTDQINHLCDKWER